MKQAIFSACNEMNKKAAPACPSGDGRQPDNRRMTDANRQGMNGECFMLRMSGILILLLSLQVLWACDQQQEQAVEEKSIQLPGEEKVLAMVNGSPISSYDLGQAVRTTLGPGSAGMLDDKGKKAVLDSLVAARAISQVQTKALTVEDHAALGKQVAAYREQLLVKQYLAANSRPEPVTQAMVEAYYKKHPEQFGAKTIKDYELISAPGPMDDARRDKVLAALQGGDEKADWQLWSRQLKQKGIGVSYAGGSVQAAVLTGQLRELLSSLNAGAKPSIRLIDGGVFLARISGEKKIPPRPLSQVSAQIRKTLAPVQLKKAVKKASGQVLADAKVQYEQD